MQFSIPDASCGCSRPKEMAYMTENALTGSTPDEAESAPRPQSEDPGYLIETGQAAGEDGSVVPIIGGLPAVEGSAWDIGAAAADRGAGLANEQSAQGD
jgi:hypothetical protein